MGLSMATILPVVSIQRAARAARRAGAKNIEGVADSSPCFITNTINSVLSYLGFHLVPAVEDRVDGVGDEARRAVSHASNILGPSPPGSPSSSLDGGDRENGGHAQSHLHWLVAGHILCGHRHSSSIEVQANSALSQGILSHGALRLTCPFQAIITVSLAWAIVPIIFFLLSM